MNIFFNKDFQKAIIIVLVLIILYKVSKGVSRYLKDNKGRKGSVDKSALVSGYNYGAEAQKLKNSLEGFGGSDREKLFKNLLNFNDNEFTHIYNLFNKLVPAPETLRDWVIDEYMPFSEWDDKVVDKIDVLNLA